MEDFKILKDLIKFNTIKDKENKEIINYIEKILLDKGLKTEYKGKSLIISTAQPAKLGFLGHTDTVEYIEGWETNPFELTQKENKLYGLRNSRYERWDCSNARCCDGNRPFNIKTWN